MSHKKTPAAMLIVGGGLSAAIAMPFAARANCGGYSPSSLSSSEYSRGFQNLETAEQREARLARQQALREARKAARLAKKAANEQAAADADRQAATAIASN